MSDYQHVRYEPLEGDDGQIVVITLDRPAKLNAISSAMAAEFAHAFHRFADSEAFVAIVAIPDTTKVALTDELMRRP